MTQFRVITAMLTAAALPLIIAAQPLLPPKVAATSLTQSAEQQSVLFGGSDWPLDMAQIKTKMLSSTREGQEPMRVQSYITSQLLPQLQQTANEVQAQADAAGAAVQECKSLLWSGEKEAAHRQSIMEKDETDRFSCLSMEHRLHKEEMDACGDLTFLSELVHKTKPAAITPLSLKNKTIDEIENILRESFQFFNAMAPKVVLKSGECDTSKAAALQQHSVCSADEEVIEAFFCTMKFGRDQACEEYASCYKDKSAAFDTAMVDLKKLEVHNKHQWKKLTCYSKAGDGAGNDIHECDTKSDTVSVAHLAVSYPAKPLEETCIHLMKTRRSYASVECKEGSVVPHGDHPGDAAATTTDANATLLAK